MVKLASSAIPEPKISEPSAQQTAKILTTSNVVRRSEAAALAHGSRPPSICNIFPIEAERVALIPEGDAASLGIPFSEGGKDVHPIPTTEKALDYIRALEDREGLTSNSTSLLVPRSNTRGMHTKADLSRLSRSPQSESFRQRSWKFEQEFGNLLALKTASWKSHNASIGDRHGWRHQAPLKRHSSRTGRRK